jgi:hypothetical protein
LPSPENNQGFKSSCVGLWCLVFIFFLTFVSVEIVDLSSTMGVLAKNHFAIWVLVVEVLTLQPTLTTI